MKSHRLWTTATLCWFFTLFNIERFVPEINLASYVYCLAAVAGVAMLALPTVRRLPFGLTASGFGILWIVGKCMLGYTLDLNGLPLAMTELLTLVVSQFLCQKLAQNTDEFELTSAQLLDVLRANSVAGLQESEPQLLEEIRRARRHERPLTFVTLTPGEATPENLSALVRKMEQSLGSEYMIGSISRLLETRTKSHDLAVRIGNQFLMLLPETSSDQARLMAERLKSDVERQLGIQMNTETWAFGVDELTLSGILERLNIGSAESPRTPTVFELRPAKQPEHSRLFPSKVSV
jgi:hypothetical protein